MKGAAWSELPPQQGHRLAGFERSLLDQGLHRESLRDLAGRCRVERNRYRSAVPTEAAAGELSVEQLRSDRGHPEAMAAGHAAVHCGHPRLCGRREVTRRPDVAARNDTPGAHTHRRPTEQSDHLGNPKIGHRPLEVPKM